MKIRELNESDAKDFSELIIDMYSNLENLEWFTPMPYDTENVTNIIKNNRFYIIGAFENNELIAVTSLDYKCGKLIGKIDFPKYVNVNKLVEFGFTMVKSSYRGNGIMKELVKELIEKTKNDGFDYAFGKVHINNLASYKSLLKLGFTKALDYSKKVNINDFTNLKNADFFCKKGKENAEKTLSKYKETDTDIIVDYHILLKKL